VVGLIGAGNFARMTLLPALRGCPARLRTIASSGGVSGFHAGRKFGFSQVTTDYHTILQDPEINLVLVVTRHDLHAQLVLEALQAGKHVMVEKPLCIRPADLERIAEAHRGNPGQQLLVGHNRRFSPHALKIAELLAGRSQPLCVSALVNAGESAADSWPQDLEVGGGRIIGEGCHWIDLMRFWAGAPVTAVRAARVGGAGRLAVRDDKMSITLSFADGSIGTLHYFANGHRGFPKETIDVFCEGRVLHLDNFRSLEGHGFAGFRKQRLMRMDKGWSTQFSRLTRAVADGGPPVVPFEEAENVMRATFAAVESAHSGRTVDLG
jgi:predicted dehydrogenase